MTALLQGSNERRFYEDRTTSLTYASYNILLSVFILSLVTYLNLRYIIGICLVSISLVFLVAQVILGGLEMHYLDVNDLVQLKRTYRFHQWLLHVYVLTLVPFMIWTAIIEAERQGS